MSSTPAGSASLSLYQLRVVLHGISPLIWRRLLVPATATIAELHSVLQSVFGWGGEHLHRFVIHGTEYGISYSRPTKTVGDQLFEHPVVMLYATSSTGPL